MRRRWPPRGSVVLTVAIIAFTWGQLAHGEDREATVVRTDEELATGRALFAEALQDEGSGRYRTALAKFQRVRDVRDTAAIEYRIATCEEGLGQVVAAAASYARAIQLAEGDLSAAPLLANAQERRAAVQQRIAHLSFTLTPPAPPVAEVLVDGVPVSSLMDTPLDPGVHVVTARAPGAVPFRGEVQLPDGGQATLTLDLHSPSPLPRPSKSAPIAGWVGVGAGATLMVGSVIALFLRQENIASLDRACPLGNCPPSVNASQVESTRSRALAEGPVAAALGAAGVVAEAVGLFIVLRHPRGGTDRVSASLSLAPGAAGFRGVF